MYSKIPITMDSLPRQKSFGCLSLKIGCIFSGLVIILYTVFALAQCLASLDRKVPGSINLDNLENVLAYCFAVAVIICHIVTLILTTIMMVGALRETASLMKPWVLWTSCMVLGKLLLIVFCTVTVMIPNHVDTTELLLYYLLTFFRLLVHIYMLTLVASYYMDLVEERVERLRTLLNSETWNTVA